MQTICLNLLLFAYFKPSIPTSDNFQNLLNRSRVDN